ncbi:MAG TPA: hypothetical protein VFS13_14080 [Steroidobacteraceae bacterium]|nr:hypothetical protein [Steroidobacteraceae bacterium]
MKIAMRAAMLVIPAIIMQTAAAKGAITRIEIAEGKQSLIVLTGEKSAGQFTIWSGPGTLAGPIDGVREMTTSERDFADWRAGPVEAPRNARTFEVRFYCATMPGSGRAAAPPRPCYGVRYAIDEDTAEGYIQIPPADDPTFPSNEQSIVRGVEGRWLRATQRWEDLVRARLDAATARADLERASIYRPPVRVVPLAREPQPGAAAQVHR